jgi:hypothetical protein
MIVLKIGVNLTIGSFANDVFKPKIKIFGVGVGTGGMELTALRT